MYSDDIMFGKINSWADSSQTLQEARKNVSQRSFIVELLAYVILYSVVFLISTEVPLWFYYNLNLPDIGFEILFLFLFCIELILVLLIVLKIEKRSLRSVGFSKDNILPSILRGSAIGFLMFLAVAVIGIIFGQYSFKGFNPSMLVFAIPFLIGFFIQSTTEEVSMRGWANTLFSKRHSVFIGFIISDIAFVLIHSFNLGLDIISVINIFIVGFLFTILFWKYDNIWVCGSAHTMWNFTQGYLLGFSVSGGESFGLFSIGINSPSFIGGSAFGPESGLIVTFVTIIAIIIALYYPKKSNA